MKRSEGGRPTRLKLNNETDQKCVRRALRYLRATVRAGEIARRVLEDIDRDGYSSRRFAIFWPGRFGSWSGRKHGIEDSFVGTLEPAPLVERGRLPWWNKIELSLHVPEESGKPSVQCSLFRLSDKGRRERHTFHLGTCNLNSRADKASFSFNWEPLEEQYYCGVRTRSKGTHYRTHPVSEPLPQRAVEQLCLCLSSVMTGSPHDKKTSPEIVALHRSLPSWLEEDGVPDRVWAEIRALMDDHRLAKAVLST